jgi:RNA polymerase sigma-70 factor (family 1)
VSQPSFTVWSNPDLHAPGAARPGAHGQADGEAADAELARRVQAGDAAAFEALFQRYYRRLYAFAEHYVGSAEVAQDLTVDVFVRVWERRAEWGVSGSPRSYLYAAVRNEALMHLRRERMVRRAHEAALRDERAPGMGGGPPDADAGVQARELADAIDHAIARLPDRTREAFVLHRRHGLSYAEVGEAMGIAPRTVETLIRRAFRSLRAQLASFLPLLLLAVFK